MCSKETKTTKKDLQEKLKALGVKRVTGFNKAKLEEMLKEENPIKRLFCSKVTIPSK